MRLPHSVPCMYASHPRATSIMRPNPYARMKCNNKTVLSPKSVSSTNRSQPHSRLMEPAVTSQSSATPLLDEPQMVLRILDHIDNKATDMGEETWVEPVVNYQSPDRLAAEINLLKSRFVVFCPSQSLANTGDYLARNAAGRVRPKCSATPAAIGACNWPKGRGASACWFAHITAGPMGWMDG